jgi:phosphatidate cytidylyltransferase
MSGGALAALAVVAVWWAPPLVFLLIAEAMLLLACREYAGLVRHDARPVPFVVWAGAAALTCAVVVVPSTDLARAGTLLPLTVVIVGAFAVFRWRGGDALTGVAAAVFAPLYLGLPIGALVLVRQTEGPPGLFLLMLTIMVSDTAQYYTGRALGRHPLAPDVSPKKTVEGAAGGFLAGSLVFAALGPSWLPGHAWPMAARLGLGALIVAAGIAGDLFESMLKRSAGVKDSSTLIPGHGGVLDRIDALLFATPVYFIALTYL